MRGRHFRPFARATVESALNLDMADICKVASMDQPQVRMWHWTSTNGRESSIVWQIIPGKGVQLRYKAGDVSHDYIVRVTTTTPHFGGVRYWWLCPHCNRRVRILYGIDRFLCRHCHDLTYITAQSSDIFNTIDNRLDYLKRKMQGTGDSLKGPWPKPRWMRWKTYSRLATEYVRLRNAREAVFIAGAAKTCDLSDLGLTPEVAGARAQQALDELKCARQGE